MELLETQCANFGMVLSVISFMLLGMCNPLLGRNNKMGKEKT